MLTISACAPKKVRIYTVPDTIRGSVVSTALELLGKPYKNGAKGPDAFDCSGLVYYVFKQYNIFLPPPAELQGRAGFGVDRNSTLPADLVFFSIDGGLHVGVIINSGEFIHASKSRGVAIDKIDMKYWRERLIGYRSVF